MAWVAIAALRHTAGKRFLLNIARCEKSLQCLNLQSSVPGLLNEQAVLLKGKDLLPVIFHADNGPTLRSGGEMDCRDGCSNQSICIEIPPLQFDCRQGVIALLLNKILCRLLRRRWRLVAIRFDNWKMNFCEQRVVGGFQIWMEPLVCTWATRIYNLRMDPYERAQLTSDQYDDWFIHNVYLGVEAQLLAGEFIATFKEYPPSQPPASFTIDFEEIVRGAKEASGPKE
jgi:hypothetical protein